MLQTTMRVAVLTFTFGLVVILFSYTRISFNSLHNSVQKAPKSVCQHSPAHALGDAVLEKVERAQKEWRSNIFLTVDKLVDRRARKWDRFEVFQNISDACPFALKRLGEGYGEGKMLCAIEHVLQLSPIIISLGSAGDYSFEEHVATSYKSAKIHTYDCTGPFEYSGKYYKMIKFHKSCLGIENKITKDGKQFITYNTMLQQLGNPYVGLLKLDIEGYEFEVIPSVLEVEDKYMPLLIAMEVHYATPFSDLSWSYRNKKNTRGGFSSGGKSVAELALFAMYFMNKGYVLISKENNCGTCSELVFLKTYCTSK